MCQLLSKTCDGYSSMYARMRKRDKIVAQDLGIVVERAVFHAGLLLGSLHAGIDVVDHPVRSASLYGYCASRSAANASSVSFQRARMAVDRIAISSSAPFGRDAEARPR